MDNDKFVAVSDVSLHWSASETQFDCPCGQRDIFCDEDSGPVRCSCGRVYRIIHRLEVSVPRQVVKIIQNQLDAT